ncbi:MAG: type II toxin-antitoxin system HicB family antitoxin [Thaumarchaeota archaeon]|nr:type II toxin-antitoxin system HicB family antitoxin [Nitrososphaerota archaeon]
MVAECATREKSDVHLTQNIKTAVKSKRDYPIVLQQDEDGRFVATCPTLPGVVTDGADEREAAKNARYAVSDMLDSLGEPSKEFTISMSSTPS